MSAETLREAARVMRERAQVATHPKAGQEVPWFDAADAYASVVALATADLLDVIEAGYVEYDPDGPGTDPMHFVCAWADNLARAYLGESR